jgi:hypothetical protein
MVTYRTLTVLRLPVRRLLLSLRSAWPANSECAADLHTQQASIGFRSPILWMTDTSPVWGSGSLALAIYGLAAGPSVVRPRPTPTISRHAIVPRGLSVQGKALLYARCSSAAGRSRLVLYASHGALRNLSLYPLSYGIITNVSKFSVKPLYSKRYCSLR